MKLKEVPNLSDYEYIADLVGNQTASVHLIKLPRYGEKGYYTSSLTADGFRRRQLHAIFGVRPHRFDLGHTFKYVDELIRDMEIDERIKAKLGGGGFSDYWLDKNVIIHESIYAFYDAVGYDYKKKKYIRPIDFTS